MGQENYDSFGLNELILVYITGSQIYWIYIQALSHDEHVICWAPGSIKAHKHLRGGRNPLTTLLIPRLELITYIGLNTSFDS